MKTASFILALLAAVRPAPKSSVSPATSPCAIRFEDTAAKAGIHFVHDRGATAAHRQAETMGSGVAWLDYDNDGFMDLYVVDSGPIPRGAPGTLYRNNGNGTFTDVTKKAGLTTAIVGMGAVAGDYDNDGWTDLFVTGYGRSVLYHNNGNGTFTDVTARAGTQVSGWSTAAAWADFDGDGFLDLFVARYFDTSQESTYFCGDPATGHRDYCDPSVYPPTHDVLFHNNGDGTFADISLSSGIGVPKGKGLGVVASDLDGDGKLDLYVANDTMINFLFRNLGGNKFEDVSLVSGAAVNVNGHPQSGMGVDAGDLAGDGRMDLAVGNFEGELNTFFHNLGDGIFEDISAESGFAGPSYTFSAFGLNFLDADGSGKLDAFIANGHVLDRPKLSASTRAERPFLMWNDGHSHFHERGCGEPFRTPRVARGSAVADYDNDGYPDVAVSNSGGPLTLLHNGGGQNDWVGIALRGTRSNRQGIGARLTLTTERGRQVREVKAGGSYLSSSDPRIVFGLGADSKFRKLEIRWPSGTRQTVDALPLRRYTVITEQENPPAATPR